MTKPPSPETAPRPPLDDAPTPQDAARQAGKHLGELKTYIRYYLSAKLDSYKHSLRSLVLLAIAGLLFGIVGAAVLVTAATLVVLGLAQGLTHLLPYPWVANLITGVVLIAVVLGATILFLRKLTGASRLATMKKYEDLRSQQQVANGHDVHNFANR